MQEQAFPLVPRDSASVEELRKGAKRAVTCGGRRKVGGGSRGEARWKRPSKNLKHAASRRAPLKRLRWHRSSQRVRWGYCFRVNASTNTFLHPSGDTDADQIAIICGLRVLCAELRANFSTMSARDFTADTPKTSLLALDIYPLDTSCCNSLFLLSRHN